MINDLSNVIQCYYITPEEYKNIVDEQKSINRLFFLTNGDVYKGKLLLSQSILVIDEIPDNLSSNKLYLYNGKLCKVKDGLLESIQMSISIDEIEDGDNIVTTDVLNDSVAKAIKSQKGTSVFTSLQAAQIYAADETKSVCGEPISILLNGEYQLCVVNARRGVSYVSTSGNGSGGNIIDVADTPTILLGIDINGIIKANLKISTQEYNGISVEDDGIYAGIPVVIVDK